MAVLPVFVIVVSVFGSLVVVLHVWIFFLWSFVFLSGLFVVGLHFFVVILTLFLVGTCLPLSDFVHVKAGAPLTLTVQ